MEHIRIDHTDIIFDEKGDGKGKIIISNSDYNYDFSYYWGAMGGTLKDFIKSINSEYFVSKLGHNIKGPINVKKTFRNLRSYIKENFEYELPWYEHMEFQKDFRNKIKDLQNNVSEENYFINKVNQLYFELDYSLIEDDDRERLEILFKDIFSQAEPWTFIVYDIHPEELFLAKLHVKLKKKLSKPVQLCLF